MGRRTLATLGPMVKDRRGERKLRDVAQEIGIGPATLMRVENGRIPDLTTFGKLCHWLRVEPGSFLGFEAARRQEAPLVVSAHLKADQAPKPATVNALAQMILVASRRQPAPKETPDDNA
jgi:transcriptional regulator with XRE-family HTH domain